MKLAAPGAEAALPKAAARVGALDFEFDLFQQVVGLAAEFPKGRGVPGELVQLGHHVEHELVPRGGYQLLGGRQRVAELLEDQGGLEHEGGEDLALQALDLLEPPVARDGAQGVEVEEAVHRDRLSANLDPFL